VIAFVRDAREARARLDAALAVVVEQVLPIARCEAWAERVLDGRADWTPAFGGEQFSLGRAFYTDYEADGSNTYFEDAAASNARVERHAPGLQEVMTGLLAAVTGARVLPRRGWCGAGVHVFPPGSPVAERGGVVHFDTEGLARHHMAAGEPAITLVAMLQRAEEDGDLDVWDVRYGGHDHPTAAELAAPRETVRYRVGDLVVLDSYRLHRIRGFGGGRARISATLHGAALDRDVWECWF